MKTAVVLTDRKRIFMKGLRDGIPIGLGYFAVAFSLGIMAKKAGLTPFQGFLMSLFTNASAGEYAGLIVITENSGMIEMILMTIVASARYFLMSCALSQHFSEKTAFFHRLLIGFEVTDEVFALEIARPGPIEPAYSYGLFIFPLIGWSVSTMLGIIVGNFLPASVVNALSVSLYGMFIAIVVPPAKREKGVLYAVLLSLVLSFAFSGLSGVKTLSSGTRTIILTVLIAALFAWLFPVKEDEHE